VRTKLAAATSTAAVIAALTPGAAFAGEVIGPPGTPDVPNSGSGIETGAPEHANSICAFSGLNDMKLGQGPIDFIVQSPGQDVRTGLTPPGVPGEACGPGTNPRNP
jgi:hypothetical protein